MAWEDEYAPRGPRAGVRGSQDHSQSLQSRPPGLAQAQSLGRGQRRAREVAVRCPAPSASEVAPEKGRSQEGSHQDRGGAKPRARGRGQEQGARVPGLGGAGGAKDKKRRAGVGAGRSSGLRRRRAAPSAPSAFQQGPAGGAQPRTAREAGVGCSLGLCWRSGSDHSRSARGRRSSAPPAAGCRGPALGADLGPCERGRVSENP